MANPQRLDPRDDGGEQRLYVVRRDAEERKIRTAESCIVERRRSAVWNVIGWTLLAAAGLTLLFSPADVRAGGHMIEWIGGVLAVIGLALVGGGWVLRSRLEEIEKPKGE